MKKKTATTPDEAYGVAIPTAGSQVPAPELPYQPRDPKCYRPGIALIGCGGITKDHLRAYTKAGYNVVALCDIRRERAEKRRAEFYPRAVVYEDFAEVLARHDVEVVDVATHPAERGPLLEAALRAGKHVLSQKPFVLDLDVGEKLADLADRQKVMLAVNQNGRWAPHFSYIRHAVAAGLIGELCSIHCRVHWDHSWVAGTPFEEVQHLILYDFAIHWFDIVACLLDDITPRRVYASIARSPGQTVKPPLLGQALVEWENGQSSLAFDGDTRFGASDTTYVTGTKGTLVSTGPDLKKQRVTLYTKDGFAEPHLEGVWFPDGFHGTMGELLCAIEEGRQPYHSARNNLRSLALCFAAVASAEGHVPVSPGSVRRLPG